MRLRATQTLTVSGPGAALQRRPSASVILQVVAIAEPQAESSIRLGSGPTTATDFKLDQLRHRRRDSGSDC